jgi:hypothetical protein
MSTTNPFSKTIDGVLNFYGTNARNEIADLTTLGATPSNVAQDYEGVKFGGPSSNYNFQQAGNNIVVTDKATGNLVARVVAPVAGTQFMFASESPLTFTPNRTNNTYQINMGSTPLSQYVAPTGGLSTTGTTLTGAKDTVTPTGGLTATSTLTDPTKVTPTGGLTATSTLTDPTKGTPTGGLSATGATTVAPTGGAATGASTLVDAGKSTVAPTGGLSTTGTPTGGATTSATTKAAPDINALLTAAAGADNRLSYGELMNFLNTNKLTLNQVSPFIGDESTRSGIMTDLGTYQTQLNRLNQSYNPADVNWYGIEMAKFNLEEGRGGTDFSNSNMATQMEAYKQGLWTPKGMPTGGASMFTTPGLQDTVFLTSGLNAARQAVPNLSTNANLLVSTLARAIQDPSLGNVEAAVRVFQDRDGNRRVSSQDVAQASAYIRALTGDPNATYGSILNRLDTGYGTLYNEQDFLNETKTSLARYVDASLAIPSWDNTTRGEAFARQVTKLNVSPETAAASLGISVDDLYRLAGGDPNIWAQLKSNKSTGDLSSIFSGVGSSSQGQSSSIYFPNNYIQLTDDPKIKSNVVNKDTPFAYDTKYVDLLNNQALNFDQEFLGRIVLDVVDDAARDKTKPADLAAEIKRIDRLHNGFATQYLNAVGLADQIVRYTGDGSFKLPDINVSFPTGPGVSGSTAAQYIKPFPKVG